MKTPDEIKKGLECCVEICERGKCPYWEDSDCTTSVRKDALAYIQQLETQNTELLTKVKQLERERDAAVADLKSLYTCETCRHEILAGSQRERTCQIVDFLCEECSVKDCPCKDCRHGSNWEWRGVKEE